MKLCIQIPCWNEEMSIGEVVRSLPVRIEGIDEIETIVVDDGSTDGTTAQALAAGVTEVVDLRRHQGLADAFSAGVEAAIRRGADVLVNTDADHQYPSERIGDLVQPIVRGEADMVIGDRLSSAPAPFGVVKMLLERLGSRIVRVFSGVPVADAASGFRAFSREMMEKLFIHGKFSYTLESIMAAGLNGFRLTNVPIRANPCTRKSRLVRSIPRYIARSSITILRAYLMYHPLRAFTWVGAFFFVPSIGLGFRFLYYYQRDGGAGHVQSLILAAVLALIGFQSFVLGLIGDVIAANRRLLEEVRLRQLRRDATSAY